MEVVGLKSLVVEIKDKIKKYPTKKWKLKWNKEKTKITHPTTKKNKFKKVLIDVKNERYTKSLLLQNKQIDSFEIKGKNLTL
jgi:hypothetical protein